MSIICGKGLTLFEDNGRKKATRRVKKDKRLYKRQKRKRKCWNSARKGINLDSLNVSKEVNGKNKLRADFNSSSNEEWKIQFLTSSLFLCENLPSELLGVFFSNIFPPALLLILFTSKPTRDGRITATKLQRAHRKGEH